MSNFKNNYSELLLLANKNILFWSEEFEFEFVPMKTKDVFFDKDLGSFIGILNTPIETLQENFKGINIKDHYDFIHVILTLSQRREEFKSMGQSILKSLKILIPEINFEKGFLSIKNEIFLERELFEEIIEIVFKIMGQKFITIKETDDEFTKREKKAKLRAERIRKNSKKGNSSNIEDSLIALVYEYPQYKLEDLFEINIYTFNYLFKYIGKIANYEVSKIAAGNGLAKKHKYFIEK